MKCLEKDRNRRYETANGFAADIERYLHDEPVQACPPSAVYRFRKFARRNKAALAFTAVLALAGSRRGWNPWLGGPRLGSACTRGGSGTRPGKRRLNRK